MKYATFLLILVLSLYATAYAGDMDMGSMENSMAAEGTVTKAEGDGVVKEVDQAKGIVTIAHEAIRSLGWSAMTMDFYIKDNLLFKKLVKGKKVHFVFKEQKGVYLITGIK